MKSKIAERIMAQPEQNISLKVEFTIITKRHGFMKWLEDKDFIVPHKEHVLIEYDNTGKPTKNITTFSNRSHFNMEDLEIRHNNKFYR